MMPIPLQLFDEETTVISLSGLTIDEWVSQYVETGRACRDYDHLIEEYRKAWQLDLRALDMLSLILDGTA
jgi:hypothetical protein